MSQLLSVDKRENKWIVEHFHQPVITMNNATSNNVLLPTKHYWSAILVAIDECESIQYMYSKCPWFIDHSFSQWSVVIFLMNIIITVHGVNLTVTTAYLYESKRRVWHSCSQAVSTRTEKLLYCQYRSLMTNHHGRGAFVSYTSIDPMSSVCLLIISPPRLCASLSFLVVTNNMRFHCCRSISTKQLPVVNARSLRLMSCRGCFQCLLPLYEAAFYWLQPIVRPSVHLSVFQHLSIAIHISNVTWPWKVKLVTPN